MRNQVFLFVFALLASVSARAGACASGKEISESDINPAGIKRLGDQGMSMREIICCLPQSWRNSYLILPESTSAQATQPPYGKYPRVVIFDPNAKPPNDPLKTALSFVDERPWNKDDSSESNFDTGQRYSIEMMQVSPSGVPEFQDIQFRADQAKKTFRSLPDNVALHGDKDCRSCHNSKGRTDARGRPLNLPFFPNSPLWSQALGRFNSTAACATKEEVREDKAQRKEFLKTLEREPDSAYNCLVDVRKKLDNTPSETSSQKFPNLNQDLNRFDRLIEQTNFPTYVSELKRTANYDKYKYAITASLIGCGDILSMMGSPTTINDFIPADVAKADLDRDPARSSSELPLIAANAEGLVNKRSCNNGPKCEGFSDDRLPAVCAPTSDSDGNSKNPSIAFMKRDVKKFLSQGSDGSAERRRGLYLADNMLKGGRRFVNFERPPEPKPVGGNAWGDFRYLMEARGIDTSLWDPTQLGGGNDVGEMKGTFARAIAKADPDLQKMAPSLLSENVGVAAGQTGEKPKNDAAKADRPQECRDLKEASLKALGGNTPATSTSPAPAQSPAGGIE